MWKSVNFFKWSYEICTTERKLKWNNFVGGRRSFSGSCIFQRHRLKCRSLRLTEWWAGCSGRRLLFCQQHVRAHELSFIHHVITSISAHCWWRHCHVTSQLLIAAQPFSCCRFIVVLRHHDKNNYSWYSKRYRRRWWQGQIQDLPRRADYGECVSRAYNGGYPGWFQEDEAPWSWNLFVRFRTKEGPKVRDLSDRSPPWEADRFSSVRTVIAIDKNARIFESVRLAHLYSQDHWTIDSWLQGSSRETRVDTR